MKTCDHRYTMIYDDDFCCCTDCKQTWVLTEWGWKSDRSKPKAAFKKKPPGKYRRK